MWKAVVCSRVPVEEQEEYFKFIREEMKPFHEAHGCRSYNVFLEVSREDDKIVAQDQLMTEVLFDNEAGRNKFHEQFDKEPFDSMLKRFRTYEQSSNRHYISVI